METLDGSKTIGVGPEVLLGRALNDVERHFAPKKLYTQGPMTIPLPKPRVSIVGSRNASDDGAATAKSLAMSLSKMEVVIVSGLAEGIDTAAHTGAIHVGGRTIAVLGTPLNRSYPAKNFNLQQEIMREHLAISQFPIGHATRPKDFVLRNRTMALISDATIIIEAKDGSGSLHQGWEALRLGRALFIWKSILEDSNLIWSKKMLEYGAAVLDDVKDVLEVLPSALGMPVLS